MKSQMTFDTLEYIDELRKSGMDESEAEAITRATARALVQTIEIKELATKRDILEIKNQIKEFEIVTKKEFINLKNELTIKLGGIVMTCITFLGALQTVYHFFD